MVTTVNAVTTATSTAASLTPTTICSVFGGGVFVFDVLFVGRRRVLIGRVISIIVAFAAAAIMACFTTLSFFSVRLLFFAVFVGGSGFLSFARGQLGALLSGDGLLVADLCFVELVFAENAVESSDSSHLLHVLHALFFGLKLVLNHHAVDCVQLVQIPDATFY